MFANRRVRKPLSRPLALCALAGLGLPWVTSCAPDGPPPPPDGGGRTSIYDDRDEGRSGGVRMSALYALCDETAQKLAQDLDGLQKRAHATSKWVITLADLNNKTGTPTTDFELIQTRLRSRIVDSEFFKDHVIVQADRRRTIRAQERINGPSQPPKDLLGDGDEAPTPTVRQYDPKDTYVLQGDFFEANRTGKRYYGFSLTLTNLSSANIVFEKQYDHAQRE